MNIKALILAMEPPKVEAEPKPRVFAHCDSCGMTKRAAIHQDANHAEFHGFIASDATKKPTKKSASKSARGASLGAAVKGGLGRRETVIDNGSGWPCGHTYADGLACSAPGDANVHHMPSADGYHAFVPQSSTPPATTAKDDSYGVNVAGGQQ